MRVCPGFGSRVILNPRGQPNFDDLMVDAHRATVRWMTLVLGVAVLEDIVL
jgi:hypothetical protein